MSDESGQREQQSETTTTEQTATTPACPHPEAVGRRWGDAIGPERQAKLQGYLDRWQAETDHRDRKGPFDRAGADYGVHLTGADVYWLARQSESNPAGEAPNLHLEGASLSQAHLEGT